MRITLYQNCILTDAYSEVFDVFLKDDNDKTALERYLETLPKITYEVEDVYITNTGKFTFVAGDDFSGFYNINYLKVEDTDNNITRYAFIETITIVNGLAVVNYIEDTWSNYASSMRIRNSLLTRSRIIDYGQTIYGRMKIPFYTIGMPYESNERPKLTCQNNGKVIGEDATIKDCNAIVTLQIYQTAKQGEITARKSLTALLKCSINDAERTNLSFDWSAGRWCDVIQEMILQSASLEITPGWNYTVSSVYLLPAEFDIANHIPPTGRRYNILIPASNTSNRYDIDLFDLYFYVDWTQDQNLAGTLTNLTGYSLSNDFKRIGVGTISQPVNVINNGTDIDVSILFSADAYNFYIYMGVQGQLIDITESFRLNLPIASQTADVTQQERTARAVETLNGTLQVVGGATSIGFGGASMGTSKALLTAGQQSGKLGSEIAGMHAVQGSTQGIVGGASSIVRGLTNAVVANLPMFTTNKGIVASSQAVLNASYGIVEATTVPDNEAQVVRYTNESGYICNEIVDTKIFMDIQTGLENKYNVVMFDYVKLYGKFSQRIASVLREILTNGVKIWYDETAINE